MSVCIAILVSLACFVHGSGASAAEPISARLPAKENFHLFLLVGQSNMAGRGKVAEEDRMPHPRVLMLNKARHWVPAIDPMHFDKPSAGVGLGRTFGIAVAEKYPDATIGLIPCAVGGSAISTWQPGGHHGQTKSHPYDDMLPRAKAAMEVGTLKGILWHQGESDSKPNLAPVYEAGLHALVARLRKDLDAPELPFIAGQLGQFKERPWSDGRRQVDAAHRALPGKLAHCEFVPSNGLGPRGDKTHFSAEAYREFGHRYSQAFFKLRE